jgi:hypothetical protein
MDLAGLSHEGGTTSVAVRGSNGARDRRAGRPRGAAVRAESLHVVQPASTSASAAEVPVEHRAAAAPDTADQLQAEYFVRLLTQNRRLTDHRIDEYRKAIATAATKGDTEGARVFRRMMLGEEHDRHSLDGMIEGLRRRFSHRAPVAVR